MEQQLQQITEWLDSHKGQLIRIRKDEMRDIDLVELQLEDHSYRPEGERVIDDYTDGSALLLHGTGNVLNRGESLPLPQNRFVIPVHGLDSVSDTGDGIALHTERGSYTLTVQ